MASKAERRAKAAKAKAAKAGAKGKKTAKKDKAARAAAKAAARGEKVKGEKKLKAWPAIGDRVRVIRSAARGREQGEIKALHKGNALIEFEDGTSASADWGTYEPAHGELPAGTPISVEAEGAKMVEPVIGQAGPVMASGPNPTFSGQTLPSAQTRYAGETDAEFEARTGHTAPPPAA